MLVAMLRFLVKPRWIAFTVFAVVVAGVCFRLAFWQLDRLDGRRYYNDLFRAGMAQAPEPVESLLAFPRGPPLVPAGERHRALRRRRGDGPVRPTARRQTRQPCAHPAGPRRREGGDRRPRLGPVRADVSADRGVGPTRRDGRDHRAAGRRARISRRARPSNAMATASRCSHASTSRPCRNRCPTSCYRCT